MTTLPTDNIRVIDHEKVDFGDVRLTVEEVGSALLENQERLDALFHDIQTVVALFSDDCSLMPIQCRGAIKSLGKIQECVQHLHGLLDDPDRLPFIFLALRYRLIFQIHRIEKQTQQVICFIESYRGICTTLSFSLQQRRKQIHRALEILSASISNLSQQTRFIKHEAQFHQEKLKNCGNSALSDGSLEENNDSKKCLVYLSTRQSNHLLDKDIL
jgi:hypothetical protein